MMKLSVPCVKVKNVPNVWKFAKHVLVWLRKSWPKHKKLAKEIEAVIRDRTVSNAGAERVFDRHGIDVSQNTISRHRNNQCKSCKARGVVW